MAIMCRNPHAVIKQNFQDMLSAIGSSMVQSQPVSLVSSKNICSLLYKITSAESMPALQGSGKHMSTSSLFEAAQGL